MRIHAYVHIHVLCCIFILPKPTFSAVANPPIITLQQLSATSVRVMWSQPSGGASVTGYIIRYNDGGADIIRSLPPSLTNIDITGLTNGLTYTISVEATSQHLSRESQMPFTLRMFK